MELYKSWSARTLCIALCLVSTALSAPHQYLQVAPGYPGVYQPQLRYTKQQQQPLYYIPGATSRIAASAANPVGAATSLKYLAVSHPQALPNQRYVITPYLTSNGFIPVAHSQVTGFGPQGYQNNNQYVVYPAGTEMLREERPGIWESFVNFITGQRPHKPSAEEDNETPVDETEDEETGGGSSSESTQGSSPDKMKPEVVPVVSVPEDPNVETIVSPNVEGSPSAEASETVPRQIARSRALLRKEEGGEGGAEGGGEEEGEEESEVVEEGEVGEEEEEDDSVVVGPGGTNPSVAQAKPAAIALAGVGGVAAAAPTATAVVGANGLAVAAPSATAVAGPSAGSPPPGLLPKGTKLRPHKTTPAEARINQARIQAARQSVYDMVTGMRIAGLYNPYNRDALPMLAYRI